MKHSKKNWDKILRQIVDSMPESELNTVLDQVHKIEKHEQTGKWERYEPMKPQLRFHKSLAQIRLFCGGNRAGKTQAGMMESIYYMKGSHPYKPVLAPNQGWMVGLDSDVISDVILPKLTENLDEDDYELNRHLGTIRINPHGSTAKFKSCESGASKFQSAERRWIWFDEEPPYDIWKECIIRFGAMFPLDIWITMTPLLGLDWTYHEIIKKQKPGKIEVFGAYMMDNYHLPMEERRRMFEEFKDKPEGAARLYGEHFQRSGLIYKGFDESVHLIDPFKIPANWPVLRAIDPHDRKPSAALWCAVSPNNDLFFCDELNDDYEYLLDEFSKRVQEKDRMYTVCRSLTDPSAKQQSGQTGMTRQEYLASKGLPTQDANNDTSYGYESIRKRISTINGPKIFVFKSCPKTWFQLTNLSWATQRFRTENDPKEMQRKKDDDLADCARYIAAEPFFYSDATAQQLAPVQQVGYTGWSDRRMAHPNMAIPSR